MTVVSLGKMLWKHVCVTICHNLEHVFAPELKKKWHAHAACFEAPGGFVGVYNYILYIYIIVLYNFIRTFQEGL